MNRAFKDITNKVLNSSGAAVIQNNLSINQSSSTALGGPSSQSAMLSKGKMGTGSAKTRSASDQHGVSSGGKKAADSTSTGAGSLT